MKAKHERMAAIFGYFIAIVIVWFVVAMVWKAIGQEPWSESQEWRSEAVAIPDPDEPNCDHLSNSWERFEQVRLLPPAQIKTYDSKSIEYLTEDKYGLHVGRLFLNEETVMPKDMWKNYKGKYFWLLHCSLCKHVYTIVQVLPGQLKATKKT